MARLGTLFNPARLLRWRRWGVKNKVRSPAFTALLSRSFYLPLFSKPLQLIYRFLFSRNFVLTSPSDLQAAARLPLFSPLTFRLCSATRSPPLVCRLPVGDFFSPISPFSFLTARFLPFMSLPIPSSIHSVWAPPRGVSLPLCFTCRSFFILFFVLISAE